MVNQQRHHDHIFANEYNFVRGLLNYSSKFTKNSSGNVKAKQLVNEAEVLHLLAQYGFKAVTVEGKTVEEQAELIYHADCIASAHGAALTNIFAYVQEQK